MVAGRGHIDLFVSILVLHVRSCPPSSDLPFCLARLKTLMSLSCTPMPVRRDTDSVALSLLPLLMEPLA